MALSKFGKAFAEARRSGKKEFSFGGKSYNTKLKEDGPKKVPTPTAKPKREAEGPKTPAKSGASRSTSGKTDGGGGAAKKMTERAEKRGKRGPVPAKATGIARKGSAISKARAKAENAPVAKEKQGPVPMKATGIARKGSAISQERARQENRPTQTTADMLKKRPIRGK